jgi:tRNA A-37 threonylcarbamoyl transferase component Bud32
MSANQKASTTMMWIKQLTSGTFSSIGQKIDRIDYLRRNKKRIAITAVLWCVFVTICIITLNVLSKNKLDAYFKASSAAVTQLASETGAILLEADFLGLSHKVSEFTDEHAALFTAILNHKKKVMAHSDPEQLNRTFIPLTADPPIKRIDGVAISTGRLPGGMEATTFTQMISFSGVQIGSVVSGRPASEIQSITSDYAMYKIFLLIASLGVAGAGLAVAGRKRSGNSGPLSVDEVETIDGAMIGPYRLREKIAQGGMAELFRADYLRRDGFRRPMVVKRVLPHLAKNQDFIDMFVREARLAALLQHPNIVQIFDFGKIQKVYFIAMEYIEGRNLGQIMAYLKSGLPVEMTIFMGLNISLGLDYSHTRKDDDSGQPLGIVHRDISPQNILISTQGEVKISDFGISKANTEPSLTQAGVIKGKLGYLSPEQAMGQPVDNQCDIYALGLVLYEILTASRVYQIDSEIEAVRTIPEMEITPLNKVRPDVPDGLNHIVMKCLEKDKSLRYADARRLHDDLLHLKSRLQISYDASNLASFMRMTFKPE